MTSTPPSHHRALLLAAALLAGPTAAAAQATAPKTATRPALSTAPTAQPAAASRFTVLDLARCKRAGAHRDGGRWTCGGPQGWEVAFAEGDLRQFLSYGANAMKQRSATQTLAPFNSIFKDGANRATIEWRGTTRGREFVPHASIVRYWADTGDSGQTNGQAKRQRTQILVVTRLGPADGTEACHAAYIDAGANPDANAMAKRVADTDARAFDCKGEPVVTGAKGPLSIAPGMKT